MNETRRAEPFATEQGAAIPPGDPTAHLPGGSPTPAWRLLDRLVLVGAALVLVVPGLMLAAGFKPALIENRPLRVMPVLSVSGLVDGSWFKGVDAFLADNIKVRPTAVHLRGAAFYLTGGTGTTDVLRGKGAWLFPTDAFNPTCVVGVDQLTTTVAREAAAFAGAGVAFRFIVVPDKQTIYPEQVGSNPFPTACTEVRRPMLRAAIHDLGADGIDGWTLEDAAKAANPAALLWYPGDTHWTSAGAIAVVRSLVTSLQPNVWSDAEIVTAPQHKHLDDLARSMGLSRYERLPMITGRAGSVVVQTKDPVSVQLVAAPFIWTTTVTGGQPTVPGRTLIIYDSAFAEQQDLVAPWFANATWVRLPDMSRHPELARQLGPFDTVIVEQVERFVYTTDFNTLLSGFGQ